jgi:hypothetical protein
MVVYVIIVWLYGYKCGFKYGYMVVCVVICHTAGPHPAPGDRGPGEGIRSCLYCGQDRITCM